MKVVFFSLTGNIKRFAQKVKHECVCGNAQLKMDKPFVLVTYTINFGEVPADVEEFLNNNKKYLKGVVGSGNKNWGKDYCMAAYKIAKAYDTQVLQTFELSGNNHDIEKFNNIIEELA